MEHLGDEHVSLSNLADGMSLKKPVNESPGTRNLLDALDRFSRLFIDEIFHPEPEKEYWTADDVERWFNGNPSEPVFASAFSGLKVPEVPIRKRSSKPVEGSQFFEALAGLEKGPDVLPFSPVVRRYFVEGSVNGTHVEALPDSGASLCFISKSLVSRLDLQPKPESQRSLYLANKKLIQSPGMVEVPWKFAAEKTEHILKCWILQESAHDLILGSSFLKATQTLTRFVRRIKSKVIALPRRLRLQLLDNGNQRLCGYLNGNYTAAFPDTGSDAMLVSRAYAERNGLDIDTDINYQIELGDGTIAWTSGTVRDMEWKVGGMAIRCDFHVLDDLCVDVVLSNDYLFDFKIFSEYTKYLDDGIEEDLSQFCNIRLIGQYGESLNLLEEEYLKDGEYRDYST